MQKALSQRSAVTSKKGNKSAVPPPASLGGPRLDLPGRPELLKRHDSSTNIKKLASSVNIRETSEAHQQPDVEILRKDSGKIPLQPEVLDDDEEDDDWNPSIDRAKPDFKPKKRSKPRGSRGRGPNRSRQEDFSPAEDSTKDTFATSNRIYRDRYQRNGGDDGWATEDVNEFKETEFNFQENLDRFDKKSVFRQLKAEDNTANEDLLVTHNRIRKNYRHDENVLEPHMNIHPLPPSNVPVVLKPTQLDDSDSSVGGPPPSMSRTRSRQSPARGGSGMKGRKSLVNEPSFSSESDLSDPGNRNATNDLDLNSLTPTDQLPSRQRFPCPFELMKSQSPCPALEPHQLHRLETASKETGFPPILLTENAGRGIALAVIKYFANRLKSTNLTPPTVLIFAGNHSPGARAIAAGRHLVSRGFKVYLIIQALEQGHRLLGPVHEQIQHFKRMADKTSQAPIKSTKFTVTLPTLNLQPDLVLDAIVNPLKVLREHDSHERRVLEMMISDAMSLAAPIMSVGIPSGFSASTGRHTSDSRVAVRAEYVVTVDAPYIGLEKLMRAAGAKNGVEQGGIRHVLLVDGGVTTMAWKKAFGWNPKIGMRWGGESVWRLGLVEEAV
jgi:enhancer of mRNA-decapping protein 3